MAHANDHSPAAGLVERALEQVVRVRACVAAGGRGWGQRR